MRKLQLMTPDCFAFRVVENRFLLDGIAVLRRGDKILMWNQESGKMVPIGTCQTHLAWDMQVSAATFNRLARKEVQ